MTTDATIELHELRPYFLALAAMVAADHEVSQAEEAQFRRFLAEHEVPEEIAAEVIARLHDPADPTELVRELRESPCRFSLYLDALALAWADQEVVARERELLESLRDALRIAPDEAQVLEEFFLAAREVADADEEAGEASRERLQAALSRVAGIGVPVAAVAASGSVPGLTAAGVVSGLTALGFGLGMVPGIGTALLLGFGSYRAVKWLMSREGGDEG